MRKLMIGAAIAALVSTSAIAGEVPTKKPIDLSISIESDSYYNSTTENITSETGVVNIIPSGGDIDRLTSDDNWAR